MNRSTSEFMNLVVTAQAPLSWIIRQFRSASRFPGYDLCLMRRDHCGGISGERDLDGDERCLPVWRKTSRDLRRTGFVPIGLRVQRIVRNMGKKMERVLIHEGIVS
ncbi:MAG: hypothetical protein OXC26_06290 [Albidovulum sp.]|nr:hypothetical protein [Albidovulum sp.]